MNMSFINMSIDVLDLSTRTINALREKNNILTTNDLWNIKENICNSKNQVKGVGRIGLREIKNAINLMKHDFQCNGENQLKKEVIEEKENLKNYMDNNLYIPTKINKTNGSYNQRYLWKKILNDYLYTVYQGLNGFNLKNLIRIFLSTLSAVELHILKNRLLFLGNGYVVSQGEIGNQYNITTERVRQIENSLMQKINEVFLGLSRTKIGVNYMSELLITNKISNYGILDFTMADNEEINGRFFAYINTIIVSPKYDSYFLNKKHQVGEIVLICNKKVIDSLILNKIFVNADKLYQEKRPEEKLYTKDVIFAKIAGKYLETYLSDPGYEYSITKYLGEAYQIFQINGIFTFPQNKKDLKFLVKKELDSMDEPIHFTKMYDIVLKKFPQYKWTYGKVQSILMTGGKNVGNGLYVRKTHHMRGGTVRDIAEEYIQKKGGFAKYVDLLKYIMENKLVKEISIETLLFDQDKQKRFVRLEGRIVGLSSYNPSNIVNSWTKYKLDERIYEFLKKNNISEFTSDEIGKRIGGDTSYNRLHFALKKLVNSGKVTSSKRGIANYYYVL